MSGSNGSLTIEAKIIPATATKPARVKAKVAGGTAELLLPRNGYRAINAELLETAKKLAVALGRDPDLTVVAPTNDGWLYRTKEEN